jgi:hypothetical protein
VDDPSTETVTLIADKINLSIVRDRIERIARLHDLQVDAVDEAPRLLSTKLRIVLTGRIDEIEAFRIEMGGGAFSGGPTSSPLDPVIGAVLDGGLNGFQRWRRSRARRKPHS